MKFPALSFKIKLIISLEIFIILAGSFSGYLVWKELNSAFRENHRRELIALASTTAAMIDPDRHQKAQLENDRKSNSYKKIQTLFRKIIEVNPSVDDIYTATRSQDGVWTYVAEGYQTNDENGDGIITDNEKGVGIGENFDITSVSEIAKGLDGPAADHEVRCGKRGCQLSGYAPVKDRFGQAMAVTAVNVEAQDVLDFEKKTKKNIAIVLGIIFIFFPLVLSFVKFPKKD